MTRDWNALIPRLPETWIDNVADPLDVALTKGGDDLLISYISFLWPDFVEYDGMVFRGAFDEESKVNVDSWKKSLGCDPSATEAMVNHCHLMDVHDPTRVPLEVQLRFIGRTCVEMWKAKLALDFPERSFEFHFVDEPGLPLREYQITFNCAR